MESSAIKCREARINYHPSKIWFSLEKEYYQAGEQLNMFLYMHIASCLSDVSILIKMKGGGSYNYLEDKFENISQVGLFTSKPDSKQKPARKAKSISKSFPSINIGDLKLFKKIKKGYYKFPVSLILPDNLSGSSTVNFNNQNFLKVAYMLTANLRSDQENLQVEKEVMIKQNHFTDQEEITAVPFESQLTIARYCGRGKLKLNARPKSTRIHRHGFIEVALDFDLERAELDVNALNISLEREVKIREEGIFRSWTEVLNKKIKGKVERGKKHKNLQIILPVLCQELEKTSFSSDFEINYQLRFAFKMADCCANIPNLIIPLFLSSLEENKPRGKSDTKFKLVMEKNPFILRRIVKENKEFCCSSTRIDS